MNNRFSREPIAVIGTSCRFPGGVCNLSEYWNFLSEGRDAIDLVPVNRWSWEFHHDQNPEKNGKMPVARGGFLDHDIEMFDASFFDISPREAAILDPQQRLILELTHEALEDAIGDVNKARGSQTGVYIGAFMLDNMVTQMGPGAKSQVGIYTAVSSTMTMISNRLSYTFDLQGPSFTLDTACSSSLVATHQACRGLLSGDCDMAITGGVSIMFRPEVMMMMSKGHFLAPDGRSKTFSANADGYGRGEGGGLVVLKRLSDALADGDTVHALIRGSGVNQDGNTDGITVPSETSQSALARRVYAECEVDPADIGYLEAHGTGTPVGDPIEMRAMGGVVGCARADKKTPLVVGSVKAGIGHLEAGAGIAGLLKSILVAKHGQIPPQAWMDTELNPGIDFDALNVRIADHLQDIDRTEDDLALIAVNSFGYGGTNAHAVVESYEQSETKHRTPQYSKSDLSTKRGFLLNVSGESEDAIRAYAGQLGGLLDDVDENTVRDICAALGNRTQHTLRWGITADSVEELRAKTTDVSADERVEGVVRGRANREVRKPVMVFSGMGPQWWAMGRELYASEPVFRKKLDEADEIFQLISGWSILDEMLADEAQSRITHTEVAQPANFMLQMGLFELLKSFGIEPDAVVGHSVGEVSAAYASGSFTLEQALTVAFHRSRTQAKTAGTGTMLAVGLGEADLRKVIEPYADTVAIAGLNSATNSTISGAETSLDEIMQQLEVKEIFARKLQVEVPYHSPGMDPILQELGDSLVSLQPGEPLIPLYSTVTGELASDTGYDGQYWCDNVREPVYFQQAVENLLDAGHTLFLEVGPHPVLGGYLRETIVNRGGNEVYLSTLNRKENESQRIREAVAGLWANGCVIDFNTFMQAPGNAPLPAYPWQRKRHWSEEHFARLARQGWPDVHNLLGRKMPDPIATWQSELSTSVINWLPDHKVGEATVFPGAGYVEALLELTRQQSEEKNQNLVLRDVSFERALVLEDIEDPSFKTILGDDMGVSIYAGLASKFNEWALHCEAKLVSGEYTAPELPDKPQSGDYNALDVDDLYARFEQLGLNYGPAFQAIKSISSNDRSAIVELAVEDSGEYTIHPALLDGAFQAMLGIGKRKGATPFLPAGIREIRSHGVAGNHCTAMVEITEQDEHKIVANLTVVAEQQVVLEVIGIRCVKAQLGADANDLRQDRHSYDVKWVEAEPVTELVEFKRMALIASDEPNLLMELHDQGYRNRVDEYATVAEIVQADTANIYDNIVVFIDSQSPEIAIEEAARLHGDVQSLTRSISGLPTLTLVTKGAQTAEFTGVVNGWASAWVMGFRRNLMNEAREFGFCRHIDIQPGVSVEQLVTEFLAVNPPDEVLLTPDQRAVLLLSRLDGNGYKNQLSEKTTDFMDTGVSNFHLGVPERKSFNSLVFLETERRTPGDGEIEVQVETTSLNFKDVAKVLGFLKEEMLDNTNSGMTLGLECAGTVVRVGEGVDDYEPGDRVTVSKADCFQRYITVHTDRYQADVAIIVKTPDKLESAESASLVVAYSTALRTLRDTARLKAGESVLIHGAAGGVGIAAVHVAKWLGATVVATAGTDEKRDYLKSIGADHVLNSRTLDFSDQIKQITAGKGVDVVLNSVGGGVATASFDALANFGRFIEIGKFDILAGNPLDSRPFDRNISYTCVDLDFLTAHNREAMYSLIDEAFDLVNRGVLAPLPVTVFGADDLVEAFSYLARSQHTGKVCVDLSESPQVAYHRPRVTQFSPDKTMLITGGLGGVGIMIANWLVENGARKLALLSRSGAATDDQKQLVRDFQEREIDVEVHACDASSLTSLQAVVDDIECRDVLGGVIHAAGVLDDKPFIEMTPESVKHVATPKIMGAYNLHQLTQNNKELELFLVISSVSALTGHTMQSNYCLGNSFMDGLCHYRQSVGLTANSLNLGPVASAGMAVHAEGVEQYLALMGLKLLTESDMHGLLSRLYEWNKPQVAMVSLDWPVWEYGEPRAAGSFRFSEIIASEGDSSSNSSLLMELSRLPKGEQIETVAYLLAEHIADILQMDSEEVDIEAPLDGFGIDSLTAVEFQSVVNRSLSVEVSVLSMLAGKTLRDVAADIVELIDFEAAKNSKQPAVNEDDVVSDSNESRGDDSTRVVSAEIDTKEVEINE